MADFKAALKKTLLLEGGYVNDPKDYGGETNFGISKKAHPEEDIKNMTAERAGRIYKHRYWDALRLDELDHQGIAEELFDTAVNIGRNRAANYLQTALSLVISAINANKTVLAAAGDVHQIEQVVIDGLVGPKTLAAFKAVRESHYLADTVMLKVLNGLQLSRYMELVTSNPALAKYFIGWVDKRVKL